MEEQLSDHQIDNEANTFNQRAFTVNILEPFVELTKIDLKEGLR